MFQQPPIEGIPLSISPDPVLFIMLGIGDVVKIKPVIGNLLFHPP
jgi:hypothetical protein